MLETEIKKLTAAIEALTARLSAVEAPAVEAPAIITADELTRVCLALSRAGKKDAIKAKLSELGVMRVGELTGDDYVTFSVWAVAQ
jgi:hypothetical protein